MFYWKDINAARFVKVEHIEGIHCSPRFRVGCFYCLHENMYILSSSTQWKTYEAYLSRELEYRTQVRGGHCRNKWGVLFEKFEKT